MTIATQTQIAAGGQSGRTPGNGISAASARTGKAGLQWGAVFGANASEAPSFRSRWEAELAFAAGSFTSGIAADEDGPGEAVVPTESGPCAEATATGGSGPSEPPWKAVGRQESQPVRVAGEPNPAKIPDIKKLSGSVEMPAGKPGQGDPATEPVKARGAGKGNSTTDAGLGRPGPSQGSSLLPDVPTPQGVLSQPIAVVSIAAAPAPPEGGTPVPLAETPLESSAWGSNPQPVQLGGLSQAANRYPKMQLPGPTLPLQSAALGKLPEATPIPSAGNEDAKDRWRTTEVPGLVPNRQETTPKVVQPLPTAVHASMADLHPNAVPPPGDAAVQAVTEPVSAPQSMASYAKADAQMAVVPWVDPNVAGLPQSRARLNQAQSAGNGVSVAGRARQVSRPSITPEKASPVPVAAASAANPIAVSAPLGPPDRPRMADSKNPVAPSHSTAQAVDGAAPQSAPGGAHPGSGPHAAGARNTALRETFSALDGAPPGPNQTWTHATSQQAEAGFQDPVLGWVGVRADLSGGLVHASVVPGSAQAAEALGKHMDGINSYLAEQHTPIDSLAMDAPTGMAADGHAAGRPGLVTHGAMEQGSFQGMAGGADGGNAHQGSGHGGQQQGDPGIGSGPDRAGAGQSGSDRSVRQETGAMDVNRTVAAAVSGEASTGSVEVYGSGSWRGGEHISLVA